jgi:cell division protein FtsQ
VTPARQAVPAAKSSPGAAKHQRSEQKDSLKSSAVRSGRQPPAKRQEAFAATEARKRLKEAVKARKSFERNEVRRFTAHLRRRRIAFFAITGSILGLVIFVGIGVFSPLMALQEVVVTGTSRVDAKAIIGDLQSQIGKPLPLVDTRSVEAALAKQPLVKSYSTQSIPPHRLVVNIVERSPIGYLDTPQGFSLVDPAGVSIEVTEKRVASVPVIDVKGASATSQGFPAAVSVLRALPSSLQGQVDRIIATTTDDVSLILKKSNVRVVWGSADQSSLKSRVLASLMKSYPPSRGAVYDVSSPASVVVR